MSNESNDETSSITSLFDSADEETAASGSGSDGDGDASGHGVREKAAFELFLQLRNVPAMKFVCEKLLLSIRNYFLPLVGTEHFAQLSVTHLETMLMSDRLGINQELEAFFVVLHWVKQSPPERQQHIGRLMACVRFQWIPVDILYKLRTATLVPELTGSFGVPEVAETLLPLVTYGLWYASLLSAYHGNHAAFEELCNANDVTLVYPRKYVYHKDCPYHVYELGTGPLPAAGCCAKAFHDYIDSLQPVWQGEGPPGNGDALVEDAQTDGLGPLGPTKPTN